MTVFNSFFRVARRYIGVVAIYVGIMVIISSLIASTIDTNGDDLTVSTQDYKIAIINRDGEDPVTQALIAFLAERTNVRPMADDDRAMREALFWREVDYVLTIPEGFGQQVLQGQQPKAQGMLSPNDYVHMYVDNYINRFVSTLSAYHRLRPAAELDSLIARAGDDLKGETTITRVSGGNDGGAIMYMGQYFRHVSYSLLAAVSSGMGVVLARLMDKRLHFRNRASSMRDSSRNLQLAGASLLYASIIWCVLIGFGVKLAKMTPADLVHPRFLLMLGASYLYLCVCMGISLLITAFTQNTQVITGVSNVVSLGSSFLGGVFVPAELLSPGVAAIGKTLPAYWYTAVVRAVGEAEELGAATTQGYWRGMGILALMLAVILGATLLVNKVRRQRGI